MSVLTDAKAAQGAQTERTILGAIARAGDAGLSVTELAHVAQVHPETARHHVRRLTSQRPPLVVRIRGGAIASGAGRIEAGLDQDTAPQGQRTPLTLSQVVAILPTEAQRAFLRLLLSGIVARHHLRHDHPRGWGSFLVQGPTGTGKTLVGELACRLIGQDPTRAVRLVQRETPGSLLGRRAQARGGAWKVEPSPLLSLPLVVLDELDKADEALRREALGLLLGDAEVEHENQVLDVAPVVVGAYNTGKFDPHDAYVRRSVLLDTTPLVPLLGDLDLAGGELLGHPRRLPRLDLAQLRPPSALPESRRRWLRDTLRTCLSEEGWSLVALPAVERLALGRAVLAPTLDGCDPGPELYRATVLTAQDYLTCAATVGHCHDGWVPAMRKVLDAAHCTAPDLAGEQDQAETIKRTAAVAKGRESLDLTERRGRLAEQCRAARASIDLRKLLPANRPAAEGLRAALARLAEDMTASRSRTRLDELATAAGPYIERANDLAQVDAIERQHQADEAEMRKATVLAEKRQVAQEKAAQAQHRRRLTEALHEVRAQAKDLERQWRSHQAAKPGQWASWLQPVGSRPTLVAELAQLHEQENQLVATLGVAPRLRPILPAASPVRPTPSLPPPRRALPASRPAMPSPRLALGSGGRQRLTQALRRPTAPTPPARAPAMPEPEQAEQAAFPVLEFFGDLLP